MRKSSILFIFFPWISHLLFAQDNGLRPRRDFEVWPSVTLEKPLSAKFDASVQQELRLNENALAFKQTFTDVMLLWKTSKYFRLSANYRFIITPEAVSHRIYGQFFLRYRQGPMRFAYRGRLEREYERNEIPDSYFRQKIAVEYNLKGPVNPFVATDWYYHIWYKPNEFNKVRIDLGINVNLKKGQAVGAFYRIQREFNVPDPLLSGIIGLAYSFALSASKNDEE